MKSKNKRISKIGADNRQPQPSLGKSKGKLVKKSPSKSKQSVLEDSKTKIARTQSRTKEKN